MADRPSKKPEKNKTFNDARKNRKAWKTAPENARGRKGYRGSRTRGVALSPVDKVLLGKGALVNIHKPKKGSA